MSRSDLTRSRVRAAWLFLVPMLLTLALVAGWPLLRTIWYGFTDADTQAPADRQFIAFDNYLRVGKDGKWYGLLADKLWWLAVKNTIWFAVVSVVLETVLGLVVALVLNASFRLRGLVRTAVLVPWAIPTIVSAKMWAYMLDGQTGVVNDLLIKLGFLSEKVPWTADSSLMMKSVIIADVWKTTPFMALLILAALQMLPSSCYEAARVDGIHPIKVFFRVTLPLIRPALMVAVIFRFLDALRIFDLIYVLTPGNEETMTMSIYVQKDIFKFDYMGHGSAAATLLFLVVASCTLIYLKLGQVSFEGGR